MPDPKDLENKEGAKSKEGESKEGTQAVNWYDKDGNLAIDPNSIPADVIAKTQHFQGHATELTRTRESLRTAEKLNETLAGNKAPSESAESQDDPDEYPNRGEVDAKLEKFGSSLLKKITETLEHKDRAKWDREVTVGEEKARQKYSRGKVAPGLDYDTVSAKGMAYLRTHAPYQLEALKGDPNAPETLYRLAISLVPELAQAREQEVAARTLKNIKAPLVGGSSGGAGAPGGKDPYADGIESMMKMSLPDLLKLAEEHHVEPDLDQQHRVSG